MSIRRIITATVTAGLMSLGALIGTAGAAHAAPMQPYGLIWPAR